MGSCHNPNYSTQNRVEIPSFIQGLPEAPPSQVVASYYEANLSDEELGEIRTRLNNLGGNPQVQRHDDKQNTYVVTVNDNFANSSMAEQILQVFRSQDANATPTAAI